ncbi:MULTISPECIES: TrmH family RNA methyltransferase [Streptomycetaceae]|uniref:Putative rRNA methylase n=1 Tax=Streptantibioticus cattleyicolor (strain ATCC 35852 / DSM 46488 / JCM 4925 / NBRC 14057 / NRRL 8057) TaxID=1003195 RepID=F8K3U7_STREN|nr:MULTISPECIES: RNA methyltransferase [Streptomycetaceae]AEW97640.1 putative rRNA methylase [Streptantibioticus cattleyicolor NRRL 8057 = DSM 46488]MYS62068.1 rRNA methyltransferase [Streptomyces sp. SID5468]CCB77961.1 putative enzyme [Streptantibioticus cattleyicolor NRRL 8057 = DSM 46488]
MGELITVDDPADPRLRDYTDLTDVELRRRREPAEGLFIAEGEKVIRRARHAGYRMRSMLLSAKWIDTMRDVIDEVPAPVYAVDPELAEQVTGYHVHRGALASMERKALPSAADLLAPARRVVVMEGVNDHTNIGAVFRSAAALGMDAVLLSPDCADPLYRRSVKVSMGAVFAVPYARLQVWPRDLETVRGHGFRLLALTPDAKASPIDEVAPHRMERVALMVGAEGEGLTTRALVAADEWVRIPMAHGVDSLNVGAAAAVAFYAVTAGRPA